MFKGPSKTEKHIQKNTQKKHKKTQHPVNAILKDNRVLRKQITCFLIHKLGMF